MTASHREPDFSNLVRCEVGDNHRFWCKAVDRCGRGGNPRLFCTSAEGVLRDWKRREDAVSRGVDSIELGSGRFGPLLEPLTIVFSRLKL